MNRFISCSVVVLFLCCAAAAQNQAPDPNSSTIPAVAPAGVTTTVTPETAQFQKLEDSWSDAINRRDQYALELVLSPLFVDISATGDVTTRNQQVALLLSNEDKTLFLTQRVITVRMLGDTAVANGTYTLHHKVGSGQVDERGVFTHVFQRVRNGWVCINSQRTVLHQDAGSKQKKSTGNETPFHFPLFSRGDKGPQ